MAYAYKRTITTGNATTSTQTDFPLLLKFDASNAGTTFKTVANGGHIQNTVTQSGGSAVTMPADLIFTSDSGGTTKIPWEIESYDAVAGTLWVHVKISSLTTSGATIYAFYGDAAVTTQQNTSTVSPSNVWDTNFRGVWHYPDGTTLSALDSTSNANNGTNTGATAIAGQIDGAASFNGTTNYIQVTNSASLNTWTAQTISTWVKAQTGMVQFARFIEKGANNEWSIVWNISAADNKITVQQLGATSGLITSTNVLADNTWHKIDVTITSGLLVSLYVDGAFDKSATSATGPTITNGDISIGRYGGGGPYYYLGLLDEFKISNSARSAAWITTEYNNQSNPLTFNTIGTETSTGAASLSPQKVYKYLQAVNRASTY